MKTLTIEQKEEFKQMKACLPRGWTTLYISTFHRKTMGLDVLKKYKRLLNISDGRAAPTKEEFNKIKQLIRQ
jgi:hypothetical protein